MANQVVLDGGGFDAIQGLEFRESMLKNGINIKENLFDVKEVRTIDKVFIRAKILKTTAVRDTPYTIEFEINPQTREVKKSWCSCVAGITARCKHGAALFHFVNHERSVGQTDRQQEWHAPSEILQARYPKGETIQQLLNDSNSENTSSVDILVQNSSNDSQLQVLSRDLQMFGLTSSSIFKSLTVEKLPPEEEMIQTGLHPRIRAIFDVPNTCPGNFLNLFEKLSSKQRNLYESSIVIDKTSAANKCELTVRQAHCKDWFIARKYRLSASKAGQVAKARKEETMKRYFFNPIPDNENLRYGRQMEGPAKEKFEEVTGHKVQECGVFISSSHPWLCGTPDGIILDEAGDELAVLEIKCPSSCSDKEIKTTYLEDNRTKLKSNHNYYYQVQLQMFLCNVKKCYFIVYSRCDYISLFIERNDAFL